jgi:hypothetical protein
MQRRNLTAVVLLGALLAILPRPALGAEPELPRVFLDTTTYVASTGRTLAVAAGGDFQAALDAALPGDVITLEAGATFTGLFVLPNKPGSGWIIVRTSAPDSSLPPSGTRVDPSYSAVMPKLVAPSEFVMAVITAPGAHHFRFIGVEFKPAAGVFVQNLIGLGVTSPTDAMPHDLIIDRCYIHGDPVVGGRRGIVLNSSASAVIDSYLADFKEVGADSEAIMGWNGPGPFKIVNNYLEAASVNLAFGGGAPSIPDLVPADIEIRHNHFAKPLTWRIEDPSYVGTPWTVKILLELKNARRVLIDGNLFERNWEQGAYKGTAVVFTVRNEDGTAPWSTVEDVTFRNNIVRHAGSAIFMHGWDDNFPSQLTRRILIRNNLFDDISGTRWGGAGDLFHTNKGIEDLIIDHNTGFQEGAVLSAVGGGTAAVSTTAGSQATFTFTGTSISWIGFRGPQAGIARVSLDGIMTDIDTFATTEEVQAVVFTATGLTDGSHTLTIEVTGLKNAASTYTFIVVDAFDVTTSSSATTATRVEDTNPSIAYTAGWAQGDTNRPWSPTHTRFVYRNNLTLHGSGVTGAGTATGIDTLATYFRGYVFERNVLVGGNESIYPPNNFFPASIADVGFVDPSLGNYRLVSSSPYKNGGTDGTDIGADIDAMEAAMVTRFEETHPSVSYTAGWTENTGSRPWSGGTAALSTTAGAQATFTFTGTSVGWIGFRGPQTGIARVFLDGAFLAEVDTFSITEEVQTILFRATGLADAGHTLMIEVTGRKNAASTDTFIVVDAFDVPDAPRAQETDPSVTYTAGWTQDTESRPWSGGTAALSTTAGVRATFAFTGTSVSWIGFRGPQTGIARVFLDGGFVAEVDTFSTTEEVQAVVFTPTGLTDASHTLTIEVTGRKNAASTNTFIVVDAFDLPAQAVARAQETNSSIAYTAGWTQGDASRAWSGGTAAFSATASAQATFTLTGTSVSWIGFRGPQTGVARVFLDGAFAAEVDTFSTTEEPQAVLFSRTGLADASHTLTIEVTGLKNAASTDAFIVVDAFDAPSITRVQDTDPSVTYTVPWAHDKTSRAWSGGGAALSTLVGAQATFTFTGTSVSWIGFRGPQTGIARVSLDGVFVTEVDTFSTTEQVQAVVFTAGSLAGVRHTLTIEVTGRKNAASTDTFIVVDAFDVTSSSPTPP